VRRHLYPKNWEAISLEIRARSGGLCECEGECGLHDGQDFFHTKRHRCIERNGEKAKYAKGKVVLTVAHLCHKPKCARRSHLKSMCQRCHLRYDAPMKAERRRTGKV
jgi:hypothetical protein